jgi:hypothetical protein
MEDFKIDMVKMLYLVYVYNLSFRPIERWGRIEFKLWLMQNKLDKKIYLPIKKLSIGDFQRSPLVKPPEQ